MILILSDSEDNSTAEVIMWLRHLKKPFIRINRTDLIHSATYNSQTGRLSFTVNNQIIQLSQLTGYWYRRGDLTLPVDLPAGGEKSVLNEMARNMKREKDFLRQFLHYKINQLPRICSHQKAHVNKLEVLEKAQQCGLLIPPTLVSGSKAGVGRFMKKNGQLIMKSIDTGLYFTGSSDNTLIMQYTEMLPPELLAQLPENFPPATFQKAIQKRYELRIVYLQEKCYAMAIFSQHDKQTRVDFRRYNLRKPNRNLPFKLPAPISKKLVKLMQAIELNTGSIDMLVDRNGDFYFLEVNPVGQFGMTSYPCNYFLEKKFAEAFS